MKIATLFLVILLTRILIWEYSRIWRRGSFLDKKEKGIYIALLAGIPISFNINSFMWGELGFIPSFGGLALAFILTAGFLEKAGEFALRFWEWKFRDLFLIVVPILFLFVLSLIYQWVGKVILTMVIAITVIVIVVWGVISLSVMVEMFNPCDKDEKG